MVVVPVPPTPGMDQADVDTSEWVLEFLKSFGGRLEQNAATYVAALETEGYDSQRNLMREEWRAQKTTLPTHLRAYAGRTTRPGPAPWPTGGITSAETVVCPSQGWRRPASRWGERRGRT